MQCKSCKRAHFIETKSSGFWASFVLILLPKCPFCMLAYGSTVALCTSAPDSSKHTDVNYAVWLMALSGLTITISMIMKYKGLRTLIALGIACSGMLLALSSVNYSSPYPFYYTGVSLILIGLWLNGSMMSFIRYVSEKTSRSTIHPSPSKQIKTV